MHLNYKASEITFLLLWIRGLKPPAMDLDFAGLRRWAI